MRRASKALAMNLAPNVDPLEDEAMDLAVEEVRAVPSGLPSSAKGAKSLFEGRDGPTSDDVTRTSDGRELRTVGDLEVFAAELRGEGFLAT